MSDAHELEALRRARVRALDLLRTQINHELPTHDWVVDAGHDEKERHWFVRLEGADKDFVTIWFELDERTLSYEAGFMPHPEENQLELFQYLLRLNLKLVGAQFAIGAEDAVYLVGALWLDEVSADRLDWVIGTVYAAVNAHWRTAMRIGFASKFGRS